MKFLMFLVGTVFSIVVNASEIVNINAGLNFTRCEKSGEDLTCMSPVISLKKISIPLEYSKDAAFPSGDYNFNMSSDGYDFVGSISVTKFWIGSENQAQYNIYTSFSSIKNNDPATYQWQMLGRVTITDIAQLNNILWAAPTIYDGNIKLKLDLVIQAPDSSIAITR
ncbi:MAG: hypothetical protein ABL927_01165 [Bdellovibrionales bacterium]